MDPLHQQRARIQDDLRGLVAGEVRCDEISLQLYSTDASVYQIKPLAVVRPRRAADAAACLQYAAEKHIPVHARGAGSGTAGESLGPGLVIDFSRFLRRIVHIDAESGPRAAGNGARAAGRPVAAAGTLLRPRSGHQRRRHRRRHDRPRRLRQPLAEVRLRRGRHVQSLQVALADGGLMEFDRAKLVGGKSEDPDPRKRDLVNRLAALLRDRADVIRQNQPQGPLKRCGYNLADVLTEDSLDLAALAAGSEGTLVLITEATLSTQALPRHRGVVLLLFESLDNAARAVGEILPTQPTACDLMDRRHVSLAREGEIRFDVLIPAETEALLLVEYEGDDPVEVRQRTHRVVDDIFQQKRLAAGARSAFDQDDTDLFWRLGRRAQPLFYRVKGPSRPTPVLEDMAVPPESLSTFLVRMQNVLKRRQITASLLCHAGQGQLHLQPFLEPRRSGRRRADAAGRGGALRGSRRRRRRRQRRTRLRPEPHAVPRPAGRTALRGPSRSEADFRSRQHSQPGKDRRRRSGVAHAQPPRRRWRRRRKPPPPAPEGDSPKLRDLIELQLNWDPSRVLDATAACNRCGECRSQAPQVRMCPIFRFAPAEEASPRAKANIIRGILTRRIDLSLLASDEFKEAADLCVHCHACRLECPAGVDIPRLMRESKGAYVSSAGLPLADWLMTRLDTLAAAASKISPLANWALGNRQMRWLLEKTLGIAQGRKLPRVASRSFLRRAARRRLNRINRRSPQKVLYFVDTYANWHDPQLGEALVAVMKHNGVAVYVPAEQKPAGMASIACGALDHARTLARRNVAILADAVRQGYHVVATEPAAALCLVHEYPQMLDDDDARLLAAHSSDACAFLWKMHLSGALQLDFKPINAVLGLSCPMPFEGVGRRLPRREPARADPRPPRASPGAGLLRHGGDVRAVAQELSQQPPRRLGPDRPAPRPGHPGGSDRVQRLQDSNGARDRQAHASPDQTPAWPTA